MRRSALPMVSLAATMMLALIVAPALGNPLPDVPIGNHYKVYMVGGGGPFPGPVRLFDQWGNSEVHDLFLDRFANPVEKNGEPIIDPDLHYTWWFFDEPAPLRPVGVIDQFGHHTWETSHAAYLLLPALKNMPPSAPPHANHYKCYDAAGPSADVNVQLIDQWGSRVADVAIPRYFCNPVEKTYQGIVYPPVDPSMHLACYEIHPRSFYGISFIAADQFGEWDLFAEEDWLLCLPAAKMYPVAIEESTWGRVKSMYQD